MSQRSSYTAGLSFGALSFASITIVNFVTTIVVARVYGVRGLGEFALAYAPTGIAWYLSTVKEQAALVRELADLPRRAPRVTGLFAATFTFSTALTTTVALLATPVIFLVFQGPIDRPELILPALVNLAAYTVLTNPGWNLDSLFSAFIAGRELFWIRLHQALAFPLVAVAIGLARPSVWGLVIGTAAASATSLVHRAVVARRFMVLRIGRGELRAGFRTLPDLLRFGVRAAPGTVANGVSNEIGTWVLGASTTLGAVGAYNRAWTLGRRFLEVNYRITEMLLPTLAKRRADGDREGFDRALVDTMRYAVVALGALAAAGGGAAVSIMSLFGPEFRQAAPALALILLMPALTTASTVQSHALFAVDRPLTATVVSFGRMVVTVAATFVLTSAMGTTGTALAIIVGLVVEVAWKTFLVRRHLSRPWSVLWPPRQVLALALAGAAGFVVARQVDGALPFPVDLLPALAAGTAAYALVFWVAGGVGAQDRSRMANLLRLARARRSGPDGARANALS